MKPIESTKQDPLLLTMALQIPEGMRTDDPAFLVWFMSAVKHFARDIAWGQQNGKLLGQNQITIYTTDGEYVGFLDADPDSALRGVMQEAMGAAARLAAPSTN